MDLTGDWYGILACGMAMLFGLGGMFCVALITVLKLINWKNYKITKPWIYALFILFAPVLIFLFCDEVLQIRNSIFWKWMDWIYLFYTFPALLPYAFVIKNNPE